MKMRRIVGVVLAMTLTLPARVQTQEQIAGISEYIYGTSTRTSQQKDTLQDREKKIYDYLKKAELAIKCRKIDDALRYYYWAYALTQLSPDSKELTYPRAGGEQLTEWIPNQMNNVFVSLEARVVGINNMEVELNFTYKGEPVKSLAFTYNTGYGFTKHVHPTDTNGVSMIEMRPGYCFDPDGPRLKYEYEFRDDADEEIRGALDSGNKENINNECIIAVSSGRMALIIGNSKYKNEGSNGFRKLNSPAKDAADVAEKLKDCGFIVTCLCDADKDDMIKSIERFGNQVENCTEAALFFYSGHGGECDGKNYLFPIDGQKNNSKGYVCEDLIVESMQKNKRLNMVFLDACRDNSNTKGEGDGTKGFCIVDPPQGMYNFYAAPSGEKALDGTSVQENSPFTSAFLKVLNVENVEFEHFFSAVSDTLTAIMKNRKAGYNPNTNGPVKRLPHEVPFKVTFIFNKK